MTDEEWTYLREVHGSLACVLQYIAKQSSSSEDAAQTHIAGLKAARVAAQSKRDEAKATAPRALRIRDDA